MVVEVAVNGESLDAHLQRIGTRSGPVLLASPVCHRAPFIRASFAARLLRTGCEWVTRPRR
jgi:hypothetical protein